MRHTNYLLKPVTIDNAKPRDKAYALTDGGGLLLEVLPSGTKTWRFKYTWTASARRSRSVPILAEHLWSMLIAPLQ